MIFHCSYWFLGRLFVILFVSIFAITLVHMLPEALTRIFLHIAVTEDMLRAEALWKFHVSDRAFNELSSRTIVQSFHSPPTS